MTVRGYFGHVTLDRLNLRGRQAGRTGLTSFAPDHNRIGIGMFESPPSRFSFVLDFAHR
ncbi:MAG: hypothetical protein BroJett011_64820 [Chloroflexota bacterium]|nr:MAG: hypothetical protein BroJett011_64820 [Chloroflexota bacterium]